MFVEICYNSNSNLIQLSRRKINPINQESGVITHTVKENIKLLETKTLATEKNVLAKQRI